MAKKKQLLGDRLRASRTARGLSLREVERRSGINSGYLSQLERNEVTSPSPGVLQRVAVAYDEPFEVLMRWAGYVEDDPEGISLNARRALKTLGEDFTNEELEALRAVLDAIRSRGSATFAVHRTDKVLAVEDQQVIRRHVEAVLREIDDTGPGPIDLDAAATVAKLVKVGAIELTLDQRRTLRKRFGSLVDRALGTLQGVLHLDSGEVYVDPDLYELKRRFVLAHEAGHALLPDHRIVFAHLDDHARLTPDFNDLLERQANQFAIELLAKGDGLRAEFDSSRPTIGSIQRLTRTRSISLQAVARRVAEGSRQAFAVAIAYRAFRGYGQLMPFKLYCSRSFEERMRWQAGRCPKVEVQTAIRLITQGAVSPPLETQDAVDRSVSLVVEGICTPYATITLFVAPREGGLRRLNPVAGFGLAP